MNKVQRDGLLKWLEDIARELEGADAKAEAFAKVYAEKNPGARYPYQAGILGAVCNEQARAVRAAINVYVMPKRAPRRRAA